MDEVMGRLTPFMLFYTEHRDAVKARINNGKPSHNNSNNNKNATTKQSILRPEEISKEVARLWRTLAPERTKDYCLLANLYAESLAKHGTAMGEGRGGKNSGGNSGGKRKLGKRKLKKDTRVPKLPASPFIWFSRHHRAIMKNEHRDLSLCDIGKSIGALWKAAPLSEKRRFEDLATEDKARYTRDLAAYKAWLARKQGSKERNENAVASAAITAAWTAGGTPTARTAAANAAIVARAVASSSSGKPVINSANNITAAGVAAPAPTQASVTNAAVAGVAATEKFATSLPRYYSTFSVAGVGGGGGGGGAAAAAAAACGAAPPTGLSSSFLTSPSSAPSSSSLAPYPPPPTTMTPATNTSSPATKRLKLEPTFFSATTNNNVHAAVTPAVSVSEAVLEVMAETRIGVSHRAHNNGGGRADNSSGGMAVSSSALSPHYRI